MWRRSAALALAESGDAHGEAVLVEWWQHGGHDDYDRALELLAALAKIRSKDAVWPLVQSLSNVRLRPRLAQTLAAIGDDAARGPLVAALVGSSLLFARTGSADEANGLGMCPGYRVALQTARGALDRGARAEAVAALQRAKAALETCRRQEARRGSLLAAAPIHCAEVLPLA